MATPPDDLQPDARGGDPRAAHGDARNSARHNDARSDVLDPDRGRSGGSTESSSEGTALRLTDAHRKHLRESCLTDETIRLARLYSETEPAKIAALLHYDRWNKARGGAIVFPVFLPDSPTPRLHRLRPDKGATTKSGKIRKYEQPKAEATGVGAVIYYPPRTLRSRLQSDCPIVFTEGEKKGLFLDQASDYAAVAGAGVDCFHDAEHARETGEWRLHPWLRDHLRIDGRRCLLAFDGDRHTNPNVDRALRRLAGMLKAAGALDVRAVVMPEPEPGTKQGAKPDSKKGIDDFGADVFEKARANGATEEEAFTAAHRALHAMLERTEPVEALEPKEAWTLVRDLAPLEKAPLVGGLRWPEEYQLRRDLTLWHAPNPEELPKLVCPGIVLPARILLDLYTGEERTEIVFRRAGRWRTAIVDRVELGDRRAAVSALRRIGVAIDSNNAAAVIGFLTAFEALNEERLPRTQCVSECGWHGHKPSADAKGDDTLTFCAPDPITTSPKNSDLVFDRRGGLDGAVRGLTTAGTLDAQRDLFRHVVRTSDAATVALCAALASPLLELVGAAGFAVHLQGDSSKGKSTMLKLAASVFGDPSSDAWLASWDSTSVGLEVRAAILRHLPLCLDEAGVVDPAIRARAVMTLTNGVGRTRGEKTGGLRHTRQWRLVVLSTGESELVPSAAGASGQRVRVLNVIVDGFGALGATGVDAIRDSATENFGHFGRAWVQSLRDAHHDGLRAAWKAAAEYLRKKADANSQAGRQALSWALLFVVEGMLRDALGMEHGSCVERYYASDDAGSANANRPLHELARDVLEDWVRSRPGLFPTLKLNASNAWVTPGDFARREMLGVLRPGRGAEFWLNRDAVRDALAKKGLDETALRSMAEHGHLVRDGKNLASKRRFDCSFGRWFVIPAKSLNFEEGPDADEFDTNTE